MKTLCQLLLLSIILYVSAQTESTIPIQGGTLHYKTFGQGESLLIINGGPGMSSEGFVSLAK